MTGAGRPSCEWLRWRVTSCLLTRVCAPTVPVMSLRSDREPFGAVYVPRYQ